MKVVLGSKRITLEDLINVTRRGYKVEMLMKKLIKLEL